MRWLQIGNSALLCSQLPFWAISTNCQHFLSRRKRESLHTNLGGDHQLLWLLWAAVIIIHFYFPHSPPCLRLKFVDLVLCEAVLNDCEWIFRVVNGTHEKGFFLKDLWGNAKKLLHHAGTSLELLRMTNSNQSTSCIQVVFFTFTKIKKLSTMTSVRAHKAETLQAGQQS